MASGPETITILAVDYAYDDRAKYTDNQRHKWNCDDPAIIPHLLEANTYDVWSEMRPYDFVNDEGKHIKGENKWILRAAPSNAPPQDLKPEWTGGSGGGGGGQRRSSGGGGARSGGKSDGDYTTSGERIANEGLQAAVVLWQGAQPKTEDEARALRNLVEKTAEVFALWIREQGLRLGKSSDYVASAGAGAPAGSPPQQSGWAGSEEAAPAATGWGASEPDGDDDIPF